MALWKSNDREDEERHPFLDQADDYAPEKHLGVILVTDDADRDEQHDSNVDDAAAEEMDDVMVDAIEGADTVVEPEPVDVEIIPAASELVVIEPGPASLSLGDEINAIVEFARTRAGEMVTRARAEAESFRATAERAAESTVREAEEAAASIRRAGDEEARAVRTAAEADVQSLRAIAGEEAQAITQAAKSMREEAMIFRQSARNEADALLESARATLANAESRASEMLAEARREVDSMLADAADREEQLAPTHSRSWPCDTAWRLRPLRRCRPRKRTATASGSRSARRPTSSSKASSGWRTRGARTRAESKDFSPC